MPIKYVTLMLVPDSADTGRQYRMPQWLLHASLVLLGVVLLGIMLFFLFYSSVLSRAAQTEKVMAENESLKRYYYKVQLLEENLAQARDVVTRLTALAGVDYTFPEMPDDSTIFAHLNRTGMAVVERAARSDYSLPAGLPLNGFVSQEFKPDDPDHYHPGVDLVCGIGTPVLATGSGVVEFVGLDSLYGHMVVLRHNDSVTTIYAHNDEILVVEDQLVAVGSRIALSGNSGQSTAPHLHYEIRINDEPINPLDNPYEETQRQ